MSRGATSVKAPMVKAGATPNASSIKMGTGNIPVSKGLRNLATAKRLMAGALTKTKDAKAAYVDNAG